MKKDKNEFKYAGELSDKKVFFMLLYCFVLLIVCYYIREWLYG